MIKKIKFPLLLKDGKAVRTMEDLRVYFDMEKVLGYYHDGKLLTWLEDRGREMEFRQLKDISPSCADYIQQICLILGVDYNENYKRFIIKEQEERLNGRVSWLKEYTDKNNLLRKAQYLVYCDRERMVYFDWENSRVELVRLSDEKVFSLLENVCSLSYLPWDQQSICFLALNDGKIKAVTVNLLTGATQDHETLPEEEIRSPICREYFTVEHGKRLLKYQPEQDLLSEYHQAEIR